MVGVTVVVLGDIGRSPRMQYHSCSLARQGYDVDILGYGGSSPIREVVNNDQIRIKILQECPSFVNDLPRLFAYLFKTMWQAITLFLGLAFKRRSSFLLVQTPPAIPTLAICWFYCKIFQSTFVIDWHNYGFKNMALTLGETHFLVRISHWFEGYFGRKADNNFCVTRAMKYDLKERWKISASVLYDKPFDSFSATELSKKHIFFKRLSKQYPVFAGETPNSTVFTVCLPNGLIAYKKTRPGLLISSTSWTEDEDFSLLFTALKCYDKSTNTDLPDIICVITGKGPLKDYYNNLIKAYEWKKVKIVTPWLEPEDYPLMLGSADLGVSLHTSTSGLDLPMKVVDMFGCCLPVAAYGFKALPELVQDGENGTIFSTSEELSEQIQDWFKGFPETHVNYDKFKANIEMNFLNVRWHENWLDQAKLVFLQQNQKKSA